MPRRLNPLGQPIGEPLPNWSPRPAPSRAPIEGRSCRLEALDAEGHAAALYAAYAEDRDGAGWTYLPYGPFDSLGDYQNFVRAFETSADPLFYAIVDRSSGRAVGAAAYLRVQAAMGSIEVGHLRYAPALQRTVASTEAMYLMMRRVFDELGYRRYEWKCDSLNAASCAAARRLGFRFEGTFRNAAVFKARNRDTAWFSITDAEWPRIRAALEAWLAPDNFDTEARQRRRLGDFMPALPDPD